MWSRIHTLLMDKDSMTSRSFGAWFRQRAQEGRCPQEIKSKEGEVVHTAFLEFSAEDCHRPWGGIPSIYSFGDCHQLAAIGRSIVDMETCGKMNTSDMVGRLSC